MRRRRILIAAALGAAVIVGGLLVVRAVRDPEYVMPTGQATPAASVAREMAYVDRYWSHRNTAEYGDFAGTDCVNFTSQALHARGWPMTATWGHSQTLGVNAYTKSWVSSTALMHYLAARPRLAVDVEDSDRGAVRVGDIAQFDWDDSGDRDHTGIVSRIVHRGGGRIEIDVAEHSPNSLHRSVDALLAEHTHAVVHYWHLLD